MGPRNPLPPVTIEAWRGLDSLNDPESLAPDTWPASLNVVIGPLGDAIALRSPANWNTALAESKPVISGAWYDRAAGGRAIFDAQTIGTTNVTSYSTAGGANTTIRSGQADAKFHSLNVNDKLYRVNGTEAVQVVTSLAVYAIGITKPAAAPSIAVVVGTSTLTLTTGVSASYAYRNSGTLHVGECSDVSAASGTATTQILRLGVVASSQTGVDGIVLFITQDGGSVRYLYTDANGDPQVYTNTTANIDITATITGRLNFRVEETVFNAPPPAGATHLSRWKNRVMYTGYASALLRQLAYYSGFDQIFYGQPWETVPPLNAIAVPNKGESLKCGVETQIGWLGLSDLDAYLATGSPTDKIDSGENTIQPTENFRQLGWRLGTRSPLTLKATPYGVFWLDQDKHLQFWPFQGQPTEIGMGLRTDLDAIQDTDALRAIVEAEWFPSGDYGGFYVLSGSTTGSTNNRTWVITVVKSGGNIFMVGAPSSIAAQCIFASRVSGDVKCLIGVTDRLREILNFDTQGAGWDSGTSIYFEFVANNETLFSTLHSIWFDGRADHIVVQSREIDNTDIRALNTRKVKGSYSARVNRYGRRQKIRFQFDTTDTNRQEVDNVRIQSTGKGRAL